MRAKARLAAFKAKLAAAKPPVVVSPARKAAIRLRKAQSKINKRAKRPNYALARVEPQLPPTHKKHRSVFGHNIYAFSHLNTNQVVYSLRPILNNNHALKQLPYNGKKTVPRALRKDHWSRFATITFPKFENTARLGLYAFHKLREYRMQHETQWPKGKTKIEMVKRADRGVPYTREEMEKKTKDERKKIMKTRKKVLGWILCDQKANSVADMAAVLAKLDFTKPEPAISELPPTRGRWEPLKKKEAREQWRKEWPLREQAEEERLARVEMARNLEKLQEITVAEKNNPIIIEWRDATDSQFAPSWPKGVVHDFINKRQAPRGFVGARNPQKIESRGVKKGREKEEERRISEAEQEQEEEEEMREEEYEEEKPKGWFGRLRQKLTL